MNQCVQCGRGEMVATRENDTVEVDGYSFSASLPAERCRRCGEVYFDGAALARFELRVAALLARYGVQSGTIFRFMRKAIGLRAADLARLLDVTHETISRWETGKRAVDRGALATLGALVIDQLAGRQETLERLRALCEPKELAKHIELGEGEAA